MSDAFWTMVGAVLVALLPVLTIQIFQYLTTRNAARLAAMSRAEIHAQVSTVKDQIDTVKLTKEEMLQIMQGRERQIMVAGIEEGRRQMTDFAGLGKATDFNPLS